MVCCRMFKKAMPVIITGFVLWFIVLSPARLRTTINCSKTNGLINQLLFQPPAAPSGDCSCTLKTGSNGGTPFSYKQLYEANRSPITKLIASARDNGVLSE